MAKTKTNKKQKENVTRAFTGMLMEGWGDDKRLRNFEKKRLKAYLRGDDKFSFGINRFTKAPIMYNTNG